MSCFTGASFAGRWSVSAGGGVPGAQVARRRARRRGRSQSRMCPAVQSGTSSCGTWPTPSATSNRHAGWACGRRARGRDRHEPVLVAVQQQHRRGDGRRASRRASGGGTGRASSERAAMRNRVVDARCSVPLVRQLDVLLAAPRRAPGRGRAAQPQHVHGGLLGGAAAAPAVQQRPAERRHGVQARRRRRPAGAAARGPRSAAPGRRAPARPPSRGAARACSGGDQPAHRVADQDRRAGRRPRSGTGAAAAGWPRPRSDRRLPWVRPKPARSRASTRQVGVSRGARAAQLTSEPPSPWTQTSSGPSAGPPWST